MPSYSLGSITLDLVRIQNELSDAAPLPFSDTYKEFICGRWRSCALWNSSGLTQDVKITEYHGKPQQTVLGYKLPYISQLVKENFNLEFLRFARLVVLDPSSIVLPHRDYLELENTLTRIHIPLITDRHCFNSEENLVFHLSEGEVWYLDASLIHSAASFSENIRLHLILDFYGNQPLTNLFHQFEKKDRRLAGIYRPPLSKQVQQAMLSLSAIITEYNFYDILAILAKQHFFGDFSLNDFYKYLNIIAVESKDEKVIEKANWLEKYCLAERQLV